MKSLVHPLDDLELPFLQASYSYPVARRQCLQARLELLASGHVMPGSLGADYLLPLFHLLLVHDTKLNHGQDDGAVHLAVVRRLIQDGNRDVGVDGAGNDSVHFQLL